MYRHRGQNMYGYKTILETTRRGGTYEIGVVLGTKP